METEGQLLAPYLDHVDILKHYVRILFDQLDGPGDITTFSRRAVILATLTTFKRSCNHLHSIPIPNVYIKWGPSGLSLCAQGDTSLSSLTNYPAGSPSLATHAPHPTPHLPVSLTSSLTSASQLQWAFYFTSHLPRRGGSTGPSSCPSGGRGSGRHGGGAAARLRESKATGDTTKVYRSVKVAC